MSEIKLKREIIRRKRKDEASWREINDKDETEKKRWRGKQRIKRRWKERNGKDKIEQGLRWKGKKKKGKVTVTAQVSDMI